MDYTSKKIEEIKEMLQKRIDENAQLQQAMQENVQALSFLNGMLQAYQDMQKEHADSANSTTETE